MTHAPLPTIAPVELMLMTVGLKAIISRDVEKITKAKLKDMAGIPKQITDLTRKLIHNELTPSFKTDFNYRGALKDLAKGWDVNQVIEMTDKFPAEYQVVGHALVIKAKDTIAKLLKGYPVAQYQTLTGSIDLIPADTKLFKFVSILEILADPLMIFSLMSTGAMLRSQSNAVREIFPTFSQAVDAALLQQIISAKADKKSFELPPRAEVGVKAWFGKGPVSTKLLQQAQISVARVNERKNAQIQPPTGSQKSQSLLTSTQKIEEATA